MELRIVDDAGHELPHDGETVGELQVRGPWITGSYFGEEDDGEKFQDGWLRTGDVGRIDDRSFVTLTDRTKDVIKSGGEWISSVELELLLAGHPDVLEASVIGVPDEKWQERPLAVIVVREGRKSRLLSSVSSSRTRWPSGGCLSAGASSPSCPRPRSASSTRSACAPACRRRAGRHRRLRNLAPLEELEAGRKKRSDTRGGAHDHGDQQAPAGSGEGNVPGDGGVISRWTEHLAGQDTVEIGQRLPPHSPDCAGCGPNNPAGLHLHVVRTTTGVEAVHRFSDAQVGAPGIAHGERSPSPSTTSSDSPYTRSDRSPSRAASPSSTKRRSGCTIPTHSAHMSPSAKDVGCYSMLMHGTTPVGRQGRPRPPSSWSVLDISSRVPSKVRGKGD